MSKERQGKMTGRMIYVATIVAMLSVTGGMAMAASGLLQVTPITQHASFYQGQSTAPAGYAAAPSLQVSTSPSSTCSGTSITMGATGSAQDILVSSTGGAGSCASGNFAEEFIVHFSENMTATSQTNTFQVTTQVGSGSPVTDTFTVATGTVTGNPFTQTLNIFIDYGAINAPSAGITILNLVID